MATGAQPDALPRISQPEERSAESQNVVQRWSDNNPLLPDLAAVDPDFPFASLLEAPTMNPPMATPPMSIPEIIDNGEPPPLPPFVPTQQLPQLAQPELPGTLPLPDALPSMPQIAQPELPNTLPPLSAPNLPTGLDTSQPGSQLQDLAQSSLPNGFPTLSAPDLPITPDTLTSNLPSLENGTVVAANISDLPDELSPLEALLGQDDTADETTINEIARQVYRHLKRRLDVEWERTRNRR
jgi:hypothetical protein